MNEMSDKSYHLWIRIRLRIEYDEFQIVFKHHNVLHYKQVDNDQITFSALFTCLYTLK